MFPRGTHEIDNEETARALLLQDKKATPEGSFSINLKLQKPVEELPNFIKLPTSGADPDVK